MMIGNDYYNTLQNSKIKNVNLPAVHHKVYSDVQCERVTGTLQGIVLSHHVLQQILLFQNHHIKHPPLRSHCWLHNNFIDSTHTHSNITVN